MRTYALPTVDIISGRDFAALEGPWRRLLEHDPAATVFQTWEWNATWWRHFGANRQLLLLVAKGPDGPLALAPLAVRRVGGIFRCVEFLGTGVSDYLGFIGRPDTMPACARAFVRALDAQPWDLVDLQQLNPDHAAGCGRISAEDAPSDPAGSCEWHWSWQAACPFVELPQSWDAFLGSLGKKMRFNIGYYERLMRREHEVSLETATGAEVAPALEEFFDLHARRWRRRWLPGALYTRALRQFHRDVAPALEGSGYLALHRLRLDGNTVAALYCFRFGGRTFYYLGGFDPELSRFSPGTVLTAYAIHDAVDSGCSLFDFLRGREPYKRRWTTQERANSRLRIARPGSIRSRLALRLGDAQQHLQEHAQESLHHLLARR